MALEPAILVVRAEPLEDGRDPATGRALRGTVGPAAADAVSHLPMASTARAHNCVNALLLTASRHGTAIQQAVGKALNAANDCYHVLIGFQCIEMSVKGILDNLAEIKHIIRSRGVDDRYG